MKFIESDRIVWVDCDDTLILWDSSEYKALDNTYKSRIEELPTVRIKHLGNDIELHVHKKNLNCVEKFWKLGYTICVHSGSGHEWAKKVVKALDMEHMVTLVMSKPMYHFDDMPASTWMGQRIWRDPITGEST